MVLGISPDDVASHRAFKAKYALSYALLADSAHAVAEAYGVWREKRMFGHKFWGVERTTFVVGADGRIAKIFRAVSPEGHAEEVAGALDGMGAR